MVGGRGGDVIFNITGGLELIFLFWRGVLSKFLLDNSSFSAPPPLLPLLIVIAQSLSTQEKSKTKVMQNTRGMAHRHGLETAT